MRETNGSMSVIVALVIAACMNMARAQERPKAQTPTFVDVFVSGRDNVHTYRIPAMIVSPSGALLVFCEARKQGIGDASPTDMVLKRSLDGGKTWLPMQVLVRG